jgi:hypothetical protein
MAAGRERGRAALGFSVHTGWAAVVAVAGPAASAAVLDRRRLEMMPGRDPESPRFVYHVAAKLRLEPARRLVQESTALSVAKAREALQEVVDTLEARDYRLVGSGVIVGNRPMTAPLEAILESHALIHAAEGELFRGAVRDASQGLGIPVTEVPARELQARAVESLKLPPAKIDRQLLEIGKAAGRPWAKDQREACLAALIALA